MHYNEKIKRWISRQATSVKWRNGTPASLEAHASICMHDLCAHMSDVMCMSTSMTMHYYAYEYDSVWARDGCMQRFNRCVQDIQVLLTRALSVSVLVCSSSTTLVQWSKITWHACACSSITWSQSLSLSFKLSTSTKLLLYVGFKNLLMYWSTDDQMMHNGPFLCC